MADRPTESFELLGDPDALPDAFFVALAGLLLSIHEQDLVANSNDEGQRGECQSQLPPAVVPIKKASVGRKPTDVRCRKERAS